MTCVKDLYSKRIKELRKAKNLTQEQFAELIGIDPRNIIKIENGQTFPRVQTLDKIIKVLDITPEELFKNEHLMDINILRQKVFDKLEKNDELIRLIYKMIF